MFFDNGLEVDLAQVTVQRHIMTQWTKAQAELAAIKSYQIGSIYSTAANGHPLSGPLASSATEGLAAGGPFRNAFHYFSAIANAAVKKMTGDSKRGALLFKHIVLNTDLFGKENDTNEQFSLSHMDLGAQNILVDDDFNFIAIIDWEFAQFAPWQVIRYPMPFPLLGLDIDDILRDPSHLAYLNVLRQNTSQSIYLESFQEIESELELEGRSLNGLFRRP